MLMTATSGGGGALRGAPAPPDGAAMSDEDYARMLQAEEDQARLLAWAGVGPEAAEGGGDDDAPDATAAMTYEQLSALTDAVGAVPRAASDAARARVAVTRYDSGRSGGGGGDGGGAGGGEEQCAVCRVELADGEEVAALPCGHAYHGGCIGAWLERAKSCPVCGKELE